MKELIKHLIYKTIGTPHFIRQIEWRSMLETLKEMHWVLKPNGSAVLTTDSFTYPISEELKGRHKKIAYVVNYHTHETLKERFEISGFVMKRSTI